MVTQIPNRYWEASLMQVAYRNANALAFHSVDTKNKYFSNSLRDFRLYVIKCTHQSAVQELHEIYDVYVCKFCRSTSVVGLCNVRPAKPYRPASEGILSIINIVLFEIFVDSVECNQGCSGMGTRGNGVFTPFARFALKCG